jgi:mRNA interferase RelE/StbE
VKFSLKVTAEAEKDLRRLDKQTQRRVQDRLRELINNPFDQRISKPIEMASGERSSRVGHWRILFEVDESARAVNILAVRHRGKAYNSL